MTIGAQVHAIVGVFGRNTVLDYATSFIARGEDMQSAEEYQLVWGHEQMRKLRGR
jgi:hypothetical protein